MPKEKKEYEDFEINLEIKCNSREELRKKIVNVFLDEKKGYWKNGQQIVTRYKYYVETLKDGKRIYLLRPTFLNKGIDFQVWIEKFVDGQDRRPSHETILEDLKLKLKENPKEYPLLIEAINKVWNCEDPEDVIKNLNLSFKKGLEIELILKSLKWLFIEQDVTYWNYDGRIMLLKKGIEKIINQKTLD